MPARRCRADSTLGVPTLAVECTICRCKFDSSTTSSSTTPIVPTPAAARYSGAGEPRPPAPRTDHRGAFQPPLPLHADVVEDQVARVPPDLVVRERWVGRRRRVGGGVEFGFHRHGSCRASSPSDAGQLFTTARRSRFTAHTPPAVARHRRAMLDMQPVLVALATLVLTLPITYLIRRIINWAYGFDAKKEFLPNIAGVLGFRVRRWSKTSAPSCYCTTTSISLPALRCVHPFSNPRRCLCRAGRMLGSAPSTQRPFGKPVL